MLRLPIPIISRSRDGEWMEFMKTYAGENVMSLNVSFKDTYRPASLRCNERCRER